MVAGTGKDREAGILGEGGISCGEVTKEKEGAAVGLDFAGVEAGGAKADGGVGGVIWRRIHIGKHTSKTVEGEAHEGEWSAIWSNKQRFVLGQKPLRDSSSG
jgi:hypothetical protein